MLMPESDDGDDGDIVFRDLIMLMLSGFVTVSVLLLAHINAPSARTAEGMEPPGNVVIEARWPDGVDADVSREPRERLVVALQVEVPRETFKRGLQHRHRR